MLNMGMFLYGSQNYGLDTPESDEDYKILLCPTFDDYYTGHKTSKSDLPERLDPEHYSVMDIVRFHELLMSGNPNCIEMLYSKFQIFDSQMFMLYFDNAKQLYEEGYVALVWKNFYSALKGIALNGMTRDGINNKSVSRAYYWHGLAKAVSVNDFKFEKALWRGDSDAESITQKRSRWLRNNATESEIAEMAICVKCNLDDDGDYLFEKAMAWLDNNKRHVTFVQEQKALLDIQMRNIVAHYVEQTI